MKQNRAFTLISTIVTLALIGILAVVFMTGGFGSKGSTRKDGLGTTIPGAVMAQARDDVCRSNLNQCRTSLEYLTNAEADDQMASSLAEARLPSEVTHCPIGKEEYIYDPQAYAENKDRKKLVHCPHPGHEKY